MFTCYRSSIYFDSRFSTTCRDKEMRPLTVLVFCTSLLCGIHASASQEFTNRLSSIETSLSQEGPSYSILDSYDSLLKDIPNEDLEDLEKYTILANIYFRKAIVELSLGKEINAINSFQKSLELNSSNDAVKKQLINLCIKHGLRDRVKGLEKFIGANDGEYSRALNTFKEIDELRSTQKLEDLTAAINISPFDLDLRIQRVYATKKRISNVKSTDEQMELLTDLIDDFSTLVKISPVQNSKYFNDLSNIYLFGLFEFGNSLNSNKKCLHYDMDNPECKLNSKILNKYQTIFSQLSQFDNYFESIEKKDTDNNNEEVDDINEKSLKETSAHLKEKEFFLKIRKENENFKNNLDYLRYKSKEFNTLYKLKFNRFDVLLSKTLVFDAFVRKDSKDFKTFSKELINSDPSQSDKFLPLILANTDKYLSKKSYKQAKAELGKCSKNAHKSKYFKQRYNKIQQHQQHQQQQQQQQQYQQQNFRHQQQQQYNAPRTNTPPKNDYYKILGVSKDADDRTIRKAYREMTKQYHPDKHKGEMSQEESEGKMTLINHAYEVLSDPEARKKYDLGEDPNDPESRQQQPQQQSRQNRGNMKNDGGAFNNFGGGNFKFNFGNGGFQFQNARAKRERSH